MEPKKQSLFFADFIRLPEAAQQKVKDAVSEEYPDAKKLTVQQFIFQRLHWNDGIVMNALRAFVTDAM